MARDTSAELEVLFRITGAVEGVVREVSGSPHRADVVGMGASGSPTERIDQAAEQAVLACLDTEGVDWDFLSEEIGLVRRGGGPLLVVDPIDGSHNALHELPFASVSMALGRETLGGVEMGVVHDLYRRTTYWAVRGQGAFRDGHAIHVRPWNARSDLILINLARHTMDRAVERARRARRIRALGCASLEIAQVAEGAGDAYLFDNRTESLNLRATDIAAAYRILLEAGGGASDAEGRSIEDFPLTVDRRTSLFAWGDHAMAEATLAAGKR
jgi:fructose-1,6-bisphosphatase/inositol monophosphatase family enzyme